VDVVEQYELHTGGGDTELLLKASEEDEEEKGEGEEEEEEYGDEAERQSERSYALSRTCAS
jgi:hypothetical protein